jgi:hypothetical protein
VMSIAIGHVTRNEFQPGQYPQWAVFVGRPSGLGNPFRIGRDGDREQCIAQFATWLDGQLAGPTSKAARKLARLRQLLAKHGHLMLLCYCAPERCHAEVIRDRLLGAAQ